MITVVISAKGIVSQIPFTPMSIGSRIMKTITRIKERKVEITAEVSPSPRAVKYPDRKTFTPINKKTGLKYVRADTVRSNTCPLFTKRPMINSPLTNKIPRIITAVKAMVIKLYFKISLIFVLFCAPKL